MDKSQECVLAASTVSEIGYQTLFVRQQQNMIYGLQPLAQGISTGLGRSYLLVRGSESKSSRTYVGSQSFGTTVAAPTAASLLADSDDTMVRS